MHQYILRRIIQAIPLLFGISVILFLMMTSVGDPLATMGGRQRVASADRQRLERQLGLDQPIFNQYVYWLVGNDWVRIDLDGDGEGDTNGSRLGVLRGDFGTSFAERGRPVTKVIGERIPATLLLLGAHEIITIIMAMGVGVFSALRQYTFVDNVITALSFIFFSMPIFWIALSLLWIFGVIFKQAGLPLKLHGPWSSPSPACRSSASQATAVISARTCWRSSARITFARRMRRDSPGGGCCMLTRSKMRRFRW